MSHFFWKHNFSKANQSFVSHIRVKNFLITPRARTVGLLFSLHNRQQTMLTTIAHRISKAVTYIRMNRIVQRTRRVKTTPSMPDSFSRRDDFHVNKKSVFLRSYGRLERMLFHNSRAILEKLLAGWMVVYTL